MSKQQSENNSDNEDKQEKPLFAKPYNSSY
jgi:hypothetical protein